MADPETGEPEITLSDSAMENGLAIMLSSLIRQNITVKQQRLNDLRMLNIHIGLWANDIGVKLTMVFENGALVFHDGISEETQVLIVADSDSILNLSLLPIKFGIPWLLNKPGITFIGKLISGSLKITGLLKHPLAIIRLTRLISVV